MRKFIKQQISIASGVITVIALLSTIAFWLGCAGQPLMGNPQYYYALLSMAVTIGFGLVWAWSLPWNHN
jgi:hypothetical protein